MKGNLHSFQSKQQPIAFSSGGNGEMSGFRALVADLRKLLRVTEVLGTQVDSVFAV